MNNQNSFILFHNILLSLVFVFSILLFSPTIYAMPKGADVQEGEVNINYPTENKMNITQGTHKGIINWQDYSIANPETVTYTQPFVSSVTLNRVTGGNPSHIMGTLTADGKIFLVNPNGILFGADSHVDAAGLIASTLNISNENFMDGNYVFKENADDIGASVINKGYIQAETVALMGQSVKNEGKIVTTLGKTTLASGEQMTLSLDTAGMISVAIDKAVEEKVIQNGEEVTSGIKNTGEIKADGGTVVLTAKAMDKVFDYAVNTEGIVQAKSLDTSNGKVVLKANQRVNVAGTINAEGGEVVVNSQGADISAEMTARESTFDMNDRDTYIEDGEINGGNKSGDSSYTFWDEGNITVRGYLTVTDADLNIFADTSYDSSTVTKGEDGSGNFYQDFGLIKTVDSGNIDIYGEDVRVRSINAADNLNIKANNHLKIAPAWSNKLDNSNFDFNNETDDGSNIRFGNLTANGDVSLVAKKDVDIKSNIIGRNIKILADHKNINLDDWHDGAGNFYLSEHKIVKSKKGASIIFAGEGISQDRVKGKIISSGGIDFYYNPSYYTPVWPRTYSGVIISCVRNLGIHSTKRITLMDNLGTGLFNKLGKGLILESDTDNNGGGSQIVNLNGKSITTGGKGLEIYSNDTEDFEVSSINASGGAVKLSASGGITNTTDNSTKIIANTLNITSADKVGDTGSNKELDTNVNTITASVTGDVHILEEDALTLTDVDTTDGSITVTADGQITATDVDSSSTDNGNNNINLTSTGAGIEADLIKAGSSNDGNLRCSGWSCYRG